MILIVGLGNPEKKFEKTRHNIGFMVIDKIALNFQFPSFNYKKIFLAQISEGKIKDKKIILAKPQTFMNNSGISVKKIINNLRIKKNENLIVIHDDLDLPLGKIRISKKRGSAGHKGVESIIKELKSNSFIRFRIGIKNNKEKIKNNIKNFVLEKFKKEEEKVIKKTIKKIIEAIKIKIEEGTEKAMTKYN